MAHDGGPPSCTWRPSRAVGAGFERHIQNPNERVLDVAALNKLVGNWFGRRDRDGKVDALGLDTGFGLAAATSVSIPMNRPCMSTSGPPELPGFVNVSVCTTSNKNGSACTPVFGVRCALPPRG